jgi:hypothetical protein
MTLKEFANIKKIDVFIADYTDAEQTKSIGDFWVDLMVTYCAARGIGSIRA